MNTYSLNVRSNNFKDSYIIKANNLNEASIKAKSKFINKYHEFAGIKVGINPTDLHNHINEILEKFMEVK